MCPFSPKANQIVFLLIRVNPFLSACPMKSLLHLFHRGVPIVFCLYPCAFVLFPLPTPKAKQTFLLIRNLCQCQSKPKENIFKIPDFSAFQLDTFCFEHFNLSLYSCSRCLSLKTPNPTGCGNHPVSGNLGCIRIFFHGLPDPTVGFGSQGMGDFFIGCHTALRYFS